MQKGPKFGPIKNKKDRTVLPKQKLIVYKVGSKNIFEPDLDPKNNPTEPKKNTHEGPKKCKKAQNLAELKTKRQGCTSKTKIDSLH